MTNESSVNILLVEDSPTDVLLTEESLSQTKQFRMRSSDRLAEALQMLVEVKFDVVLLDLGLPDSQGLETLRTLLHENHKIAVVVLTGKDDDDLALQALREGAKDYLVKGNANTDQLRRTILYAVERQRAEELLYERTVLAAFSANVGMAFTRDGSLPQMLQACAESMVRNLDAAFARIWTLNEDQGVLELEASAGMYTHLDGEHSRVPVGKCKISLIAQERKPHLTNDVANDPRIGDPEWAKREGMVAFAGYPLLLEGRLVGVAAMFARRNLSETTLDAMGNVANQIALGIERKRGEESLRSAQERLEHIVSSSPAVVYSLELDGDQVVGIWVSDNIRAMLGFDPSQTRSTDWWYDNLHPEYRSAAQTQIPDLIRQGRLTSEYRFRDHQGQFHWIRDEKRLIRNKDGRPIECVGSWMDITKSKQAEQELHRTNQNLQALIQACPLAIMTVDEQWNVMEWNPASERIFGWKKEEISGGPLPYVPPEKRAEFDTNLRKAFEGHALSGFETYRLRKDGSRVDVRIFTAPLYDVAGQKIIGSLALAKDITDQKKLEEQFRQAQKMDVVGQLAGGVAHDFNNLLTVISGYSELLLTMPGLDDSKRNFIGEIGKAGERAASLTRQLLAFSRKQILAPSILDLNTLITDSEKMLRRLIGEDVTLTATLDPALDRISADAGQIEQVILNLAVNARDAMPMGGKLTIETTNVKLDEIYTQTHAEVIPGDYVLLAVSDSGQGMTAEIMGRIFEPFFTTKGPGKGTGLGLATVYGIIKQNGGHVAVYSEVGVGTAFKVYLPALAGHRPSTKSLSGVWPMPKGTETILLVEDEDAVRAIALHTLKLCGYQVLEASNGVEALRQCEKHQGAIDLIVTDVVMPEMAGRLLTEHLAKLQPELKVLYMSGYTDDAVIRHGVLQAETAFLQKPFSPHALAVKVREVLDQ